MKIVAVLTLLATTALGAETSGFGLGVMIDGQSRAEYFHAGTIYVEAIRGARYALRLTNPTPVRVGVALSVDGLNTINAQHTDARGAAKWVLEPYESTVISGWQVSDRSARDFYFTGERRSYGAALGQIENLGVIEAVFFRERRPQVSTCAPPPTRQEAARESAALSDDYAATGMGRRNRHDVESVDIDFEPAPAASIRIRYEFAPQLVKMGILRSASPLERRERARGFSGWCPEPSRYDRPQQ